MTIRNLTPHAIVIECIGGGTLTIPPDPVSARVGVQREGAGTIEVTQFGMIIPLFHPTFGETVGLPEKNPADILIVSSRVKEANPDRDDLYVPGDLIRDERGNVIGCRGLDK